MSSQRLFGLSIRTKVLLLSVLLLAIPYVGYKYLREMETYLREGLEYSLLGAAQALAGALHDRPALFEQSLSQALRQSSVVYLHSIHHPIQLDGYPDDWQPLLSQARRYTRKDLLKGRFDEKSLSFRHLSGKYGRHIYALFLVRDDRTVYRSHGSLRLDRCDHLRIAVETPEGYERRYILTTSSPGWVNAHEITGDFDHPRALEPEVLIKGEWQDTDSGYSLEIRIPSHLVGPRMAFAIADVDDARTGEVVSVLGTAGAQAGDRPGILVTPSPEIENLLKSLGRTPGRRVRVLDAQGRVIAKGGNLLPGAPISLTGFLHALFLGWPETTDLDNRENAPLLHGEEIDAALDGSPATRWRARHDRDLIVVSAAYPIRGEEGVLGAVLVEETTHSIQSAQRRAMASLFSTTFVTISIGTLFLLFFASRLSGRLHRLRNGVEAAVDPHGRVTGELTPSRTADEIGDLSRSYVAMMERLHQYNHYLETMAGRLSHELRTPLAVVKSSLDNLEAGNGDDDPQVFIERAKQALERLSLVITRMGEATRLEQALQSADIATIDLTAFVQACLEGYKTTWPETAFQWQGSEQSIQVRGCPDLLAQMLDKIVSNAVDFCMENKPVTMILEKQPASVSIQVMNYGPPLPDEMRGKLFESMVSIRAKRDRKEPHLGLGLHIAKLIAEFHNGHVSADNMPDGGGVKFTVGLPRALT